MLLQSSEQVTLLDKDHEPAVQGGSYAVYAIRGRGNLHLPCFVSKGIHMQISVCGTLHLSNYGEALLLAPYRPDYKKVFGASGIIGVELRHHRHHIARKEAT